MNKKKAATELITTEQYQSRDLEAGLLGSLLLDGSIGHEVFDALKPSDFTDRELREIFTALAEMFAAGSPLGTTALVGVLAEKLRAGSEANRVLGAGGVVRRALELAKGVPHPGNFSFYIQQLRALSGRRKMTAFLGEAQLELAQGRPLETLASDMVILANTLEPPPKRLQGGLPLAREGREYIDRFIKGVDGAISTGLTDLDDKLCGGLRRTHLTILAARPGMGKSSLARQIMMRTAREGVPVLFFTLEVARDELSASCQLTEAGVVLASARKRGGLTKGEEVALERARMEVEAAFIQAPVFVDDTSACSLEQVRSTAHAFTRRHGPALIIIDYLQLMTCRAMSRRASREERVGAISQGLKALAKETNSTVLALCQLNRKCEERKDKRPLLSDLRESGNLEQDADGIIFLYREHTYDDEADSRAAEVILRKNRQGPGGTVECRWSASEMTFKDDKGDDGWD